jgi:hypothetical protein
MITRKPTGRNLARLRCSAVCLEHHREGGGTAGRGLRGEQVGAGGAGRGSSVEAGHFGVKVTLLEPGAVSSGASERAATLLGDDDPYLPLARQLAAARGTPLRVEEVAQAVADAVEDPDPPDRAAALVTAGSLAGT